MTSESISPATHRDMTATDKNVFREDLPLPL